MEEKKRHRGIFDFVNDTKVDKVTLIIVICLFLISIVAIFSVKVYPKDAGGRISDFKEQILFVLLGSALIWGCCRIKDIKWLMLISKYSIIPAIGLLLWLVLGINIKGVLEVVDRHEAVRALLVLGKFQLHVYEVAKVFMVMYLSWAVHTWKEDNFKLTRKIAEKHNWKWLRRPFVEEIIYIGLPIGLVFVLVLQGSNSSGIFIAIVMFFTILIGGYSIKSTAKLLVLGCLAGLIFIGLNEASGGKLSKSIRVETLIRRITDFSGPSFEEQLHAVDKEGYRILRPGTKAYRDFIDDNLQVQSAKIGLHEGKWPKGPGGSTQKYVVPQYHSDFMYSFLIEEYGLLGGIFILILFGSLLARGSFIAKNCESTYARTAVGGLTVLISGQALMHILVNVGMMPMTGQTLPLISDGKGAFLMFSLAFGVLLSISKFAKENIERAEKEFAPDIVESGDEIQDRMSDLDELENLE